MTAFVLPVKDPNLVEAGVSRLIDDFKTKRVIAGTLRTWLRAVKKLDDEVIDVIQIRLLDNAAAASNPIYLDTLGRLVGEGRQGRTNAQYLPAIIVRVRSNRAQGVTLDVFEVVRLVWSGSMVYCENAHNFYRVQIEGFPDPLVQALEGALARVRPAGYQGELTTTSYTRAQTIRFRSATSAPGSGVAPHSATTTTIRHLAHCKRL